MKLSKQILIFAILLIVASIILFLLGWEVWEIISSIGGIIIAILIFYSIEHLRKKATTKKKG
ncbi:hypothetical protein [Shouchella lehensis]|uniref:Uncharacterized protein n=1 Tax=Shouchella lehensis TaxID=300825 RepID=A0A4Y7WLQ9_9BACI|nr:hypothetical protein [Shouchella lehensis]MBG9783131.1 hypothetical protein [Shouchella lehensis]TES49508.1 hypothetical protein E2L03_08545 [Shouchella lehensis]